MSTGADCHFQEVAPGRWKYALQRYPYGETEEYDRYGPFPSFTAAQRHLDQNHANPGGWGVKVHPTEHVHEWVRGESSRQKRVGVEVTIRVTSLGPEPDLAKVVQLVRDLPASSQAWGFRPLYQWVEEVVTSCASCGEERSS